jgi:putative heme-binding domain-containing protein
LLVERQGRVGTEALSKLLLHSPEPRARVHAAWLLKIQGNLDKAKVLALLSDREPGVRENAVILAEDFLGSLAVQARLAELTGDPISRVRFQIALSLGQWDSDDVLPWLVKIAWSDAEDVWMRRAVASSASQRVQPLVSELNVRAASEKPSSGRIQLGRELAAQVGSRREPAEVAAVMNDLAVAKSPEPWCIAVLAGLAEGMGRRGTQLGAFLKGLPAEYQGVDAQAGKVFLSAAKAAADARRDPGERLSAIGLLAHSSWPTAEPTLVSLLEHESEQPVRLAAVRALAAHSAREVSSLLMKGWRGYTPAMRREVTEAMLRQPDRISFLLAEMEAGRVKPGDLDASRARQLLGHRQPEIRDRARKLLQETLPAERKQMLERYRASLSLAGEPRRGREVFHKNCATCHRVAGIGMDVGPDIADSRVKTPEQFLTDILLPNQAIDSNYINYVVSTKSGKVLTGMIAAETASSITLRRAENQTDAVLKQDIEEMQSTGLSLMPEGLEKDIPVEEMAHLIAFLKNWRYLEGNVPLGSGR